MPNHVYCAWRFKNVCTLCPWISSWTDVCYNHPLSRYCVLAPATMHFGHTSFINRVWNWTIDPCAFPFALCLSACYPGMWFCCILSWSEQSTTQVILPSFIQSVYYNPTPHNALSCFGYMLWIILCNPFYQRFSVLFCHRKKYYIIL